MKRFLMSALMTGLIFILSGCGKTQPEFHGEMNIQFATSNNDTKVIEKE